MWKLFKSSKSTVEKLQEKYEKLLAKSHELSTVNRSKSDEYFAQANEVLKEIESIVEN